MQSVHEPVLLHEVVAALMRNFEIRPPASGSKFESNPTYLDGTLGGAGHALAIADAYTQSTGNKLSVIGLDRDEQAIIRAKEKLAGKVEKLILEKQNFRDLDCVLDDKGIQTVDLILFDLGISSDELDTSGRGFTFQKDEPLQMTMGDPKEYPFTARDIVNNWEESVIADIIFGYGEERFARRIARAIVVYREKKPIETTYELAEIVTSAVPIFYRRSLSGNKTKKIHPATKTFQAIRIAVNDELGALRDGLNKGYERLSSGGRMAVISFHSLEDRIVKDFYKEKATQGAHILTKKPITAGIQEIAENPRSRSAKLRVIEK